MFLFTKSADALQIKTMQILLRKSFPVFRGFRSFSTIQKLFNQPKEVSQVENDKQLQTSFAKKAKENAKTATYSTILLGGLATTLGKVPHCE